MDFLRSLNFWVAAVLLAVTGGRKAVRPIADLAATMVWPARVPVGLVRFLGIAEMLAPSNLILLGLSVFVAWDRWSLDNQLKMR